MNQCPNRSSQHLISGKIGSSRAVAVFSPAGQRFLSMSLFGGTQFTGEALACLDCGFVSGFTSPAELQAFIQKHCAQKPNEPAA